MFLYILCVFIFFAILVVFNFFVQICKIFCFCSFLKHFCTICYKKNIINLFIAKYVSICCKFWYFLVSNFYFFLCFPKMHKFCLRSQAISMGYITKRIFRKGSSCFANCPGAFFNIFSMFEKKYFFVEPKNPLKCSQKYSKLA